MAEVQGQLQRWHVRPVLNASERSQLDEVRQLSKPFRDDTAEVDNSEVDNDPFEDVSDFFPEYD